MIFFLNWNRFKVIKALINWNWWFSIILKINHLKIAIGSFIDIFDQVLIKFSYLKTIYPYMDSKLYIYLRFIFNFRHGQSQSIKYVMLKVISWYKGL